MGRKSGFAQKSSYTNTKVACKMRNAIRNLKLNKIKVLTYLAGFCFSLVIQNDLEKKINSAETSTDHIKKCALK